MGTFTVLLVLGLVVASRQQIILLNAINVEEFSGDNGVGLREALTGQNGAQKEEFHAWMNECLKETGVSNDVVKSAFRDNVFANDAKLKCYFKCMLLKNGVMSDAGVINAEALKDEISSFMDRSKVEAAVEKCKSAKGADPCEIAFEFEKCMHTELEPPPTHGPPPASGK